MVPTYTDISHFRAPYKNAYFSGYGAIPPEQANLVTVTPTGATVLKPQPAAFIWAQLMKRLIVLFPDDDNVRLAAPIPGDIRENAGAWAIRKLNAGQTVLAGTTAGVAGWSSQLPPEQMFLTATSDPAKVQEMTRDAMYAVLATPRVEAVPPPPRKVPVLATAGMGPGATAIVVVAVAAGVILLGSVMFGKKRSRT